MDNKSPVDSGLTYHLYLGVSAPGNQYVDPPDFLHVTCTLSLAESLLADMQFVNDVVVERMGDSFRAVEVWDYDPLWSDLDIDAVEVDYVSNILNGEDVGAGQIRDYLYEQDVLLLASPLPVHEYRETEVPTRCIRKGSIHWMSFEDRADAMLESRTVFDVDLRMIRDLLNREAAQ